MLSHPFLGQPTFPFLKKSSMENNEGRGTPSNCTLKINFDSQHRGVWIIQYLRHFVVVGNCPN